jgi:uncharacterized repeat protein (TIGR01451 family)
VAITNYHGLNFGQTANIQLLTIGGGAIPPDPQGAVGPDSYVEAVNLSVAIFDPKTNGINPTTDSLDDFFGVQGNLPDPNPSDLFGNSFTDPQVIFDNQTQRFLVGAMEVDPGPAFGAGLTGNNSSVFDLAVSRSSNPTTATAGDWTFYQVNTTETNEFSDFPGNLGFNGGALVITLNEFNIFTLNVDHVLVNALSMSDLTNGVPQANLHVFQSDFQGANLRPTTMHDSILANDPMWLVQEHPGAGGLGDGQHIDVVKMTDVLSSAPMFTTTTLAVKPYTDISLTPPLQPDGTVVTPAIDSRILKVAEQNNLLVVAHSVSVSPTQDDAQWYVIDVNGTPVLKQQGDVSGGNNTYITYPAIDINPNGDIGMTYMQSGTDTPTDFLSMYITGRTPPDPTGTMEAPVVAQAGQQVYEDFGTSVGATQRAGDLSGINVDANGNFWAINEFADNEPLPTPLNPTADWGTNITSFTLEPLADLAVTASGPSTVTPGSGATYTITLTNNGPDDAKTVVLSDILPAGATNPSIATVSNPDGFNFTLTNGVFTSAPVTVAHGHTDQITVTVAASASLAPGAVFDDSALATSSTPLSNPSDNAATVIGSTGPSITISTNYNAINFGQAATLLGGAGSTPPDAQGAVGPNSYIEAVNDAVAIFSPRTSGVNPTTDTLDDFFAVRGGLPDPNPSDLSGNFFTDPQVIFDNQTQRFLVGVMEIDPGPQIEAGSTGNNSSVFDVAVSKSSTPATLMTADWNFYQVRTTETNEFSDYPGNLGFNGGALVVTLNEFNIFTLNVDHVLVNALSMSDLTNGVPQANLHVFQSDFQGANLRPTTMHDSIAANDPMWLVQEHLDANGNPDGQHIDVVKMTDVLSSTPTFTTTILGVNPYAQVVQPLQPDGSGVTPTLDSRIQKVAEQGGTLVAAHAVADTAGNQDLIQWYQIDVSGSTPVLHDQGDVGSGPNTYLYFPGIDIDPAGDIGMSYIQSGTDNPSDFMSMYVTGRAPSDPVGTMEAPVLAQAGLQVYEDFGPSLGATQRTGDLSGINVDSSGNFWAINEFADAEALPTTPGDPVGDPNAPAAADWGTNVTSFTVGPAHHLAFGQQPTNTTAGQSITPAVTVLVEDRSNTLVTSDNTDQVTLAIGTNPGGGTLSGSITITVSGGIATFSNLSVNRSGIGYTVTASASGLGGATSGSFTISAAAADHLAFLQPPTSTTAGVALSPDVTVQILDAFNNLTSSSATVSVAATGPGPFTAGSTTAVAAVSGTATFSTLVLDSAGSYTVTASSTGLSPATSASFTISAAADLAVANTGPAASIEGNDATYTITVTNHGPSDAQSTVLTDTLGANLTFVSATTSQGTFSRSGGVVTFTLGTVASGRTVTARVTARSAEDGKLSESASVTSSTLDPIPSNNSAFATTAVAEGAITVSAPFTTPFTTTFNLLFDVTVATFTHAHGMESASAFIATINWGDGTTSGGTVTRTGTIYSVFGSHTYGSGPHTIATTVVESGSAPNVALGGGLTGAQSGLVLPLTAPGASGITPTTQRTVSPAQVSDLYFSLAGERFGPPTTGFGPPYLSMGISAASSPDWNWDDPDALDSILLLDLRLSGDDPRSGSS